MRRASGRALRHSGLPRDAVFITTKFYPGNGDAVAAVEPSLRRLGVDHVDLYLIHWPQGGPTWAWPDMERARQLGAARSIGVSNFSAGELEQVMRAGTDRPALNQVVCNPVHYRRGLLNLCLKQDVAVEAYSPLGTGRHLPDKTVRRIAERAGRTPAQVLLRWCVQRGIPVIPRSRPRS